MDVIKHPTSGRVLHLSLITNLIIKGVSSPSEVRSSLTAKTEVIMAKHKKKHRSILFKGDALPKFKLGQVIKISPLGGVSIIRQSLRRKKKPL